MAYNEEVSMMMSVVPGSLTGISALMGGLSSITNVFTDITRQVDATFGLIDTSIIAASTIVAQLGLNAANAAGEFEQGLKVAQMVSGQTAQEMNYLREKANEFSVSFRVDIDQITEGLQTLGRAGLNSASEQSEVLQNGLSTAKLEGRDLNGVLEELIQNTALLGGNLKSSDFGEQSRYLNDIMVATSMTAPITTHDVSETLKYSGGIAAAAGANVETEEGKAILEDYMGAIAAFAQKGVTGSIAGTALRAFFNKPATQDSSVTDALASIHLKPEYLWEDDEQTMKPVSEQIKIITDQMDDLNVSTMDRLQIWSKIVGGKMGQQMIKLNSEDIKELTSDIRASEDAGSLAAGTFDTYQMKMKEMTEQGQVAFRQFGEYAAAVLTPLLEVLKRILEFFSNPIVSGGAFVAALALILSGISKIKAVFSSLKSEFATIMHYVKTGDHLMAYRPSTERKVNRFAKEELEKKYPGLSGVNAYAKERLLQAEEKMQEKGYSLSEIDVLRQSQRLKSNTIFTKKREDIGYSKSALFPKKLFPELDSRDINDAFIVNQLVETGLWKEKYSETFYDSGRDLAYTVSQHTDEMIEDIYNFNKRRLDEEREKVTRDSKIKKMEWQRPQDTSMFEENPSRHHLRDYVADKENAKRREENQLHKGWFGKTNPFMGMTPFDEAGLIEEVKRAEAKIYNPSFVSSDARNSVDPKKQFRIRREKLRSEYAEKFIDNMLSSAMVAPMYIRDEPVYSKIDGSLIQGPWDNLFNRLNEAGVLPNDLGLQELIKAKLETKVGEGLSRARETFLSKFTETILPEQSLSLAETAMLSREDFERRMISFGANKDIDFVQLQREMLLEAGIHNPLQAGKAFAQMRPYFSEKGLSLMSDTDFYRIYQDTDPAALKQLRRSSMWEEISGYDPVAEVTKKEERERRALNKRAAADNKRRQKALLATMFAEGLPSFTPRDPNKIRHEWNNVSKEDRDLYLKPEDMADIVKKYYPDAKEIQLRNQVIKDGKVTGHNKRSRKEVLADAFPYLIDWSVTSKDGGLSNKEFANFAKSLGIDVSKKKNRKEMIQALNEHLMGESYTQDIKEQAEKEFAERLKQEENITQYFLNENKILQEQLRIMKEIQEARESSYTNIKYNYAEAREQNKDVRDRIQAKREKEAAEEKEKRDKEARRNPIQNSSANILRERKREKEKGDEILKAMTTQFDSKENDKLARAIRVRHLENEKKLVDQANQYAENMALLPRVDKGFKIYDEPLTGRAQIKNKFSGILDSAHSYVSTGINSFKRRLDADRSNSFLNFGKGSKTNKFLNAIDMLGGEFLVATELATAAIELGKQAFENYCEELKKAGEQLKEAYSDWSSADSSLERSFKNENPDITDEELDEKMLSVYSTMQEDIKKAIKGNDSDWLSKLGKDTESLPEYKYDEEAADGTLKQKEEELTEEEEHAKAIKENTGALYAASAKVTQALNKYVRIAQDGLWGVDGLVSKISDSLGSFVDKITHLDTNGSTFSENGDFLLTASQKDQNYAGYTEMAGLMLEDFKDAGGNWITGMKIMMGDDAYSLSRALGGADSKTGKYLKGMAQFASGGGVGGLSSAQNAKFQQSMKNDPKTWKRLAKELAKRDTSKKLGKDITKNQNRIKLLTEKIRQTVGNGFKASQIQRAAYIQQLQDMKAIADQAIVPIMQTNLGIAGQTLSAAGSTEANTKNTTGTTGATNSNAAIIAGLVAVIARQSAKQEFYDQVLAGGEEGDADMDGTKGTEADKELYRRATEDGMTADKFYQQNAADYNEYLRTKGSLGNSHDKSTKFDWMEAENKDKLTAGMKGYLSLIEATAKMTGYDYDKVAAKDKGREFSQDMIDRGVSLLDAFSIVDQNYTMSEGFKDAITNAYLMAQDEGEGSDIGGSGSGDKDNNDTGTRKERVDLVLCNRKTIPKLNVNLFKKPPSFTILNKNFKLRDVKINSEDKPKAIMAAIKNSFIDIQKRTDPKIIQDEDAVYDPAAATDGTNVPSGSAKTNTS